MLNFVLKNSNLVRMMYQEIIHVKEIYARYLAFQNIIPTGWKKKCSAENRPIHVFKHHVMIVTLDITFGLNIPLGNWKMLMKP